MPKRRSRSDQLDDIEDVSSLLLTCLSGIVGGCACSSVAYVLTNAFIGSGGLAVAAAICSFPLGFVLGVLGFKFRWFLRGIFD